MEHDVILGKIAQLAALRAAWCDLKSAERIGDAVNNRRLTHLYQEQAEILLQLSREAQDNGKDELSGLIITVVVDLRNDDLWQRLLPKLTEWLHSHRRGLDIGV